MSVTPFAARAARASAAIGRAFGEAFDFIPMTAQADVNLPSATDVSRATMTGITGVWEAAMKTRTPQGRGLAQDNTSQSFAASAPSVSIADADVAWMPVKGDLCRRELDGSIYEISGPYPDGFGRTVLKLSSRKRILPSYSPSLDLSDLQNSQYLGAL